MKAANKNIIQLNKAVYPRQAVLVSIRRFKKLADLNFSENEEFFFINFKKNNSGAKDILKDEFCNFVLGMGREF